MWALFSNELGLMKTLLLFDLGGVCVDWNGITELAALSGLPMTEAAARFAGDPICTGYEKGEVDDETFTNHMITLFNLPYSPAQFRLQWRLWVGEAFEGVVDTIKTLRRSGFTTACLSNTNAMHWEHLSGYLPLSDMFDHCFASHLIGAIKPNKVAFDIVMDRTAFAAQDIIFFDDSQINVDAAGSFGLRAYKVDSARGVMPTLQAMLKSD